MIADHFRYPAVVVTRAPLRYGPDSTTEANFARLPNPDDYADMELAYREQPFPEAETLRIAGQRGIALAALAIFGSVGVVLVGQYLPLAWGGVLAPAIAFLAIAFLAVRRRLTLRRAAIALVAPMAFFTLAYGLSAVLLSRTMGAAFCAVGSLTAIAWLGGGPTSFYMQWLYAHPRLRPSTRNHVPPAPRPRLFLPVIVLTIALIVPIFSTVVAMVLIVGVCAAVFGSWATLSRVRRQAIRVLGVCLTYGENTSGAPGVWRPHQTLQRRIWTIGGLVLPFYLALTIALTAFAFDRELLLLAGSTPSPVFGWDNLSRSPVGWTVVAFELIQSRSTLFLWTYPIALVTALFLPPLVLLAIYRDPLLALHDAERRVAGPADTGRTQRPDDDGRVEWQWYVDRMKDSAHVAQDPIGGAIREADHLFLGIEPHARFPVLLHEKLLSEHAYFMGDSGSGKTSLGLMPLIMQLMRGHAGPDGATTPSPPMVIIDLKGDPALFNLVRKEAAARGQEFRFFTTEKGMASHYFNPFDSFSTENRSDIELCNLMLDALGLNHGEGYGRGYFSRQSRGLLLDAITHERKPQSFDELYEVIKELRTTSDVYQDTVELVSTIHALTQYPILSTKRALKRPEQAVHMPSVIERRQVVYFWLSAAVESVSAREIAKLALYSLLSTCIDRQRSTPGQPVRQVYVVIDEFQRIAAENFKIILEQARSFGLSAMLANQSIADLDTPSFDLRPTIRTNTRVKRYFSVTDPKEIRDLADGSGQEVMRLTSTSTSSSGHASESARDMLKPRFTTNDILAVSDHPLDSILHVSRGSGYTQFAGLPIVLRSGWPIARDEYERLQATPWPDASALPEEELTVNEKSAADIDEERSREVREKQHEMMLALLAQKA